MAVFAACVHATSIVKLKHSSDSRVPAAPALPGSWGASLGRYEAWADDSEAGRFHEDCCVSFCFQWRKTCLESKEKHGQNFKENAQFC